MLDLDALLRPINDVTPSGQDLRSSPIYLQIREARRQEEEVAQGVWKREVKKADYPLVVRLATDALQTKGKELQIAAWLMEAAIYVDGLSGLRSGTQLLIGLLDQFWESVFPVPDEDGDLEFRATALAWVATQLEGAIRRVPITSNGFSWLDYHEAKSIPTEAVAERDSAQRAIRLEAINRQRPTPEDIEEAFLGTPATDYDRQLAEVSQAQEALATLSEVCDRRFGDVAPSFVGLQETLAEIAQTVRVFRARLASPSPGAPVALNREVPPPPPAPTPPARSSDFDFDDWGDPVPAPAPQATTESFDDAPSHASPGQVTATRSEPASTASVSGDPFDNLAVIARGMREADPSSPAPYLLIRAARWGELYASGFEIDERLLEAPPAEIRIELRRLSQDGVWDDLLEATERAAVLPCGRGWLDLQRYTVRAAEQSGYHAIARAVQTQVAAVLSAYPSLTDATLNDDTPAANPETREWLERSVISKPPTVALAEPTSIADKPFDPFHEAVQAARRGRVEDAFALLSATDGQPPSGRSRFLNRLRLAELCVTTGRDAIAEPILRDLADEIDRRQLGDWESHGLLAQILSSLYRCSGSAADEVRHRLYAQICCLDPARALGLEKP